MPIQIDHQLREFIPHSTNEFPITYFHDELITLTDLAGPLHWHPDFEIVIIRLAGNTSFLSRETVYL